MNVLDHQALKREYLRNKPTVSSAVVRKGNIPVRLDGLGDRSQIKQTWRSDNLREANGRWRTEEDTGRKLLLGASVPASFKNKLDNETDILNSYWGWIGIIEPEYDLLEPYTILDTESFLMRALKRQHSLMFRNGVTITGTNDSFVTYLEKRLDQVGFVTNHSFTNLLKDVLWHLLVCSNCVLLKIRDANASGGIANDKNKNKTPIAGYKIVPTNTIFPFLNGNGQIVFWRRYFGSGRPYKDYPVEDIVHFFWDRKPGHLFGTPRLSAVRDDIYALRRLEENAELLLLNHLFPFYHVAVGSKEAPCEYYPDGTSEADYVRAAIENMPKEGVFVTDERVVVEVHGSQGQALVPDALIAHYMNRVLVGLGVSGIDVGLADTANRSTSETVSQNLKDAIKADLDWFSDQVSFFLFKDLFSEANWALSVQNALSDVRLEFHEIDVDTQIKKDTHNVNLYNNHAISRGELRVRMKTRPMRPEDEKDTNFQNHVVALEKLKHSNAKDLVKLQHEQSKELAAMSKPETTETPTKTTKVEKTHSRSASGGVTKKTATTVTVPHKGPASTRGKSAGARATEVKVQPRNQHKTNLDPHKARSSEELLILYEALQNLAPITPKEEWTLTVQTLLDQAEFTPEEKDSVKKWAQITQDPDLLYALMFPKSSIEQQTVNTIQSRG